MASKMMSIKMKNKTDETSAIGTVELSIIIIHEIKNAVIGLIDRNRWLWNIIQYAYLFYYSSNLLWDAGVGLGFSY